MKYLFPYILISFYGFFGCSNSNSSITDKPYQAQSDSLRIDSLRKDILAAVYKKTEMIAYGKSEFGMTEKQFKKVLPQQDNFIGSYEYYFNPQYGPDGKMYSLNIESTAQDASHLDTDVNDKMVNLHDVISKKYGPPTTYFGEIDFLKFNPGKAQYRYSWELSNKIIFIGIGQQSASPLYYAVCDITNVPMADVALKEFDRMVESEKNKDSDNF